MSQSQLPPQPRTLAWFQRKDEFVSKAIAYHTNYFARRGKDDRVGAEERSFALAQTARVIYESNLIEKAGLSEGDTRRLIGLVYPETNRPATPTLLVPPHASGVQTALFDEQIKDFTSAVETQFIGENAETLQSVVITSDGHSRGGYEVVRHMMAMLFAGQHITGRVLSECLNFHKHDGPDSTFITESLVKAMHQLLSRDLLPDDCDVQPGDYRIHSVTTGDFNVVYPASENLQECMTLWVTRSNELMRSLLLPSADFKLMCRAAASISYDFVRIHPFPDFNGRMSRLLLCAVLGCFGVPFDVALRGDKRGKDKYFHALKRANKGRIDDYEALIAMNLVETYEAFDANLVLAGLPSLLST